MLRPVRPFRLRLVDDSGWRLYAREDCLLLQTGVGKLKAAAATGSLLHSRPDIVAVINAGGADTLYELYERRGVRWNAGRVVMDPIVDYNDKMDREHIRADTIASAIEINRPVNLKKCLRALDFMDGVVRQVPDQAILDAKAKVGEGGFGCEPASGASVAGAKLLRREGVIAPSDRVVCILTGHELKDPSATVAYHTSDQDVFNKTLGSRGVTKASHANRAVAVPNELDDIIKAIQLYS